MIKFTAYVDPMGAPRMTQRDRWKKRPCVVKYRQFKDDLRAEFKRALKARGMTPADLKVVTHVSWRAYLPIPKSYSKKKREATMGHLHDQKPDRDNIDKAILDALFLEDKTVARGTIMKLWDDGNQPRIEIEIG